MIVLDQDPAPRRRFHALVIGVAAVALTASLGGGVVSADTVTSTITVGNRPHGVAVDPDGTNVYVTNYGDNSVSVIDAESGTVVGSPISVGASPVGVAVSPSGDRVYVTNQHSGSVSVIDTASDTVVGSPIRVGSYPRGVVVSPDGDRVYVVNELDDSVSVIDTTAAFPVVTSTVAVGSHPYGVAVSPDGGHVYLSHASRIGSVSVIDTASDTVVGSPIPAGEFPDATAVSPDGNRLYVINKTTGGAVSVIDTTSTPSTTASSLAVGSRPFGIAINSVGTHAYVTTVGVGNTPGSVSVITIDQIPTVAGVPPGGVRGQFYSHTFTISGQPTPSLAITEGALPDGLTLTAAGVLSGTPTAAKRFTFTVAAFNSVGDSDPLPVTIEIVEPDPSTGSLGPIFGS